MKRLPLLLSLLLALPAAAQPRRNLLETLGAALAADTGYEPAERAALLAAIKTRFADYGLQVVDARRRKAIPVVLHLLTEGSFDQAPAEQIAEVAFAAYQAMARGADPEVVEGIALYGYRKKIPAETLAAWANGYRQLVEGKVPGDVAADLVRVSMERGLPDGDFNTLKWALVDGVKNGFDSKDYASTLFSRVLSGALPGRVSAETKAAFRAAKKQGKKPVIPAYEGVFTRALPPPPVFTAPEAAEAVPPTEAEPDHAREHAPPEDEKPPVTAKTPVAPKPVKTAPRPPEAAASPALRQLWPGLEASAKSYLGTPYVWGGVTHQGIDCSALTQNSYGENRVKIPRVSRDQWKIGSSPATLREGDLIFFNTMGAGVSHVGMLLDPGGKSFIHASSSKGVMIADLNKKYYQQRYLGARRVVP
ncbi:MAG: C40 family peptidase [Elusimicrobia bacterium]|nr:C40 family peptidase [Elusimicrobiota bacterium]